MLFQMDIVIVLSDDSDNTVTSGSQKGMRKPTRIPTPNLVAKMTVRDRKTSSGVLKHDSRLARETPLTSPMTEDPKNPFHPVSQDFA